MKAFDSKINDEPSKTSSMRLSTGLAIALFVIVGCGLAGIQFYAVYTRYIELSNRIADLENSVKDLKERVQELEAIETRLRQDASTQEATKVRTKLGSRIEENNSISRQSKEIGVYQRRRRATSDTDSQAIGLIGPPGRDGADGRDGRDGVPGIPGSPGVAGVPGDRGQKGDLGNDGPLGTKGENGFKGEEGKYGPIGPKGDACDINPKDFASMLLQTLGDQHDPALNVTSQKTLGSLFGGGSVYTRWGRTTCPETGAELVYEGIVGGSLYSHKGGSSEYICLPSDPEWDNYSDGIHSKAYIYGAEYRTSLYDPFERDNSETLNNHDVPCAVCRVPTRATELMIPARTSCPDSWTKEYSGYLMAGYYDHPQRVNYICVDRAPETVTGTSSIQYGALLYVVEGKCGSLPCFPYVNGRELACSVCTI